MSRYFQHLLILSVIAISVTVWSAPALAIEQGDWLVRLRGIGVIPTDESGGIRPDLTNDILDPQPAVVPEIDITYMLTDNIGIELIAATSPHDFEGGGPTIGTLGDVASTWLLPPTLTVQWHFLPKGKFRPYVGAGVNYTITYNEDAEPVLENALGGPTDVDASNSFGFAVQAGFDIGIDDRWFFNVDLKYIDMSVDIDLTTGTTKRTVEVEINPIIFGVGIGYRF